MHISHVCASYVSPSAEKRVKVPFIRCSSINIDRKVDLVLPSSPSSSRSHLPLLWRPTREGRAPLPPPAPMADPPAGEEGGDGPHSPVEDTHNGVSGERIGDVMDRGARSSYMAIMSIVHAPTDVP